MDTGDYHDRSSRERQNMSKSGVFQAPKKMRNSSLINYLQRNWCAQSALRAENAFFCSTADRAHLTHSWRVKPKMTISQNVRLPTLGKKYSR
jgi:hypothetical protein